MTNTVSGSDFNWTYDIFANLWERVPRPSYWDRTAEVSYAMASLPVVLSLPIRRLRVGFADDGTAGALRFRFDRLVFPTELNVQPYVSQGMPGVTDNECYTYDLRFFCEYVPQCPASTAEEDVDSDEMVARYISYGRSYSDNRWYRADVCTDGVELHDLNCSDLIASKFVVNIIYVRRDAGAYGPPGSAFWEHAQHQELGASEFRMIFDTSAGASSFGLRFLDEPTEARPNVSSPPEPIVNSSPEPIVNTTSDEPILVSSPSEIVYTTSDEPILSIPTSNAMPTSISERHDEILRIAIISRDLETIREAIQRAGNASSSVLQDARKLRDRLKSEARKAGKRKQKQAALAAESDAYIKAVQDLESATGRAETYAAMTRARSLIGGKSAALDGAFASALERLSLCEGEGTSAPQSACVVCLDADPTHIVVPCGHHCICAQCSFKMKAKDEQRCPLCRQTIDSIIQVFYG